jgi:uncharacterized protein (TIGR00369 family)
MSHHQEINDAMQLLQSIYEKIPFNSVLGLSIRELDVTKAIIQFQMQEKLIGNYIQRTLHGGVISSVLDVTGGITASLGVIQKCAGASLEEVTRRISMVGTIDLRVDYLRPGRGDSYAAEGAVMRTGNKVSVTRMELYNDQRVLIAVGTGTYIVG